MKQQLLLFLCIVCTVSFVNAQETLGLLLTTEDVYDGYTLFTPELNTNVYLIDNCGNLVNEWNFNELPGATCYLLENGNLLRAGKNSLEIRDWDNAIVWNYNLQDLGYKKHHDIAPLPNGNILCLIKNIVSVNDQIALGKNPALINSELSSEKVIEFQPVGTNQISIVWEWNFLDHIIQDFDTSKPNYGVIGDHSELVDFNYGDYNMAHSDWLHMNSIDYNADLDQIIMSSKSLGEIYIIDHSTTTAEAASHFGGNSSKGGDFLWRWGNPEVYQNGTTAERKLFEQHDAKWVKNGYLHEGKISVFNNDVGATQTHSAVALLIPQLDNTNAYESENSRFLPQDFSWSWSGEILGQTFFEIKKGGAQSLPNGHMLICETSKGRLTEIDAEGNSVWIYTNPSGPQIYGQYTTAPEISTGNSMFRGEKYPSNYVGLTGDNLTPSAIIENENSNSELCNEELLSVDDISFSEHTLKVINPVKNNRLQFNMPLDNSKVTIIDALGRKTQSFKVSNQKELELKQMNAGLYFAIIGKGATQQIFKIVVE